MSAYSLKAAFAKIEYINVKYAICLNSYLQKFALPNLCLFVRKPLSPNNVHVMLPLIVSYVYSIRAA